MKKVAITMGEPGGIGPEVALKAAAATQDMCAPVLVGDMDVFGDTLKLLNFPHHSPPPSGGYHAGVVTAAGLCRLAASPESARPPPRAFTICQFWHP